MDLSLYAPFIEMTIPNGVRFNRYNVALRGLRHEFRFNRLRVQLNLCSLNGRWGGALSIYTNTWVCGSAVMKESLTFSSFEECADYLWWTAFERIERGKEGITMEFLHFKVAYNKWLTLMTEQKYELFKEVDFYATV